MRSLALRLTVLALLVPSSVRGQERAFPYALGRADVGLLAGGLGLSLAGEALEAAAPPTAAEIALLRPTDVNGFDRQAARWWSPAWADRSDVTRGGLVAAAGVAAFAPQVLRGRARNTATLGVMFAETYLLLRGSTYTTKRLTDRKRPYLFNDALAADERRAFAVADGEGALESFYSGHAAAAFAAAALLSSIVEDVHGPSATADIMRATSFTVAGFTAYARVRAGKHYPSDVLVGALVGTGIGLLVPRMHRIREGGRPSVSVSPGGVAVRWPWPRP